MQNIYIFYFLSSNHAKYFFIMQNIYIFYFLSSNHAKYVFIYYAHINAHLQTFCQPNPLDVFVCVYIYMYVYI